MLLLAVKLMNKFKLKYCFIKFWPKINYIIYKRKLFVRI